MKPLQALFLCLFLALFSVIPSLHAAAPVATTGTATNVTVATASLRGTVNPNGLVTTAWFDWGTTTNYDRATPRIAIGNGNGATSFSSSITNLTAATIYHFRIAGSNVSGTTRGADATLATLGVLTMPAGDVTATGATLRASVNPGNAPASVRFEWGATTNYGNTTAVQNLSAGSGNVIIVAPVTTLVSQTAYHFRVVATNNAMVLFGKDELFTTLLSLPPTVFTAIPTNITTNSAQLRGTVNPNDLASLVYFEWGPTTNYGLTTVPQALAAGAVPIPVQADLSSLTQDATYHYRVVASNALGISSGENVAVTATELLYLYAGESWTYVVHDLPYTGQYIGPGGGQPRNSATFSILPASFLAGSSLLVNGKVVNSPTNYGFAPFTPGGTFVLTALSGSMVVTRLDFYVEVYQGGGKWLEYGNSITPTRNPQPALIATQYVSNVGLTSAVVQANVNAHNLATGLFVQWGTTTNYGSATDAASLNFDYLVWQPLSLINLAPGTLYHARVLATNSAGTTYGPDLTFTTPAPITVVTLPASNRKTNSVTLNATATLSGLETGAYFEWGATTNYNQVTPVQNLGSATGVTNVSAPLTGLSPQTAYYARAVVFSAWLTNYGADVAFSTVPVPADVVVTNCLTDDVRAAIERGGTVTFACDGVVVLTNHIEIANNVCLDASGHSITFSGSNVTRLFKVQPGIVLTLTNLTLSDGRSTNGGAIYNEGTVVARDCRFLRNWVVGANGANGTNGLPGTNSVNPGTPGGPGGNGQDVSGGAIHSAGQLDLRRCFFDDNRALGGSGGVGGRGGNAGPGVVNGAGVGSGGAAGIGGSSQGGSVLNMGLLVVTDCTFSNSYTAGGVGGSGGGQGCSVNFISNPHSAPGGVGGPALGSAIYNAGQGFISNSLFAANSAVGGAGAEGLYWYCINPRYGGSDSAAGHGGMAGGGAIYNLSNSSVVNCTFLTNTATGGVAGMGYSITGTSFGGNGIAGNGLGGALANAGNFQASSLTLSGNAAIGGGGGFSSNPGLIHPSGSSLGGSIANPGGVFQIVNSILAGGSSNNCYGVITDLGHNLSSDATPTWTSGSSLNNTDPLLLPLANNGGPTLTMALRAGSPALNTANCAAAPATDQRGFPRPAGPGCDLGAYEGEAAFTVQIIRGPTMLVRASDVETGRSYRLDACVNFGAWTSIATNTATGGQVTFPVTMPPTTRFFRITAQ